MANLRDIKRRIKSVKSTQQITKAMKMVSAAKLRRAQERALAYRAYADGIREVAVHLAALGGAEGNPLAETRETRTVDLIAVTSDKGLAGSFNSNVLNASRRFILEHIDTAAPDIYRDIREKKELLPDAEKKLRGIIEAFKGTFAA